LEVTNLTTTQTHVSYTILTPANITESLRFYHEGLGLGIINSLNETGDYKYLFGATADTVLEIYLGDPAEPKNGVLNLVEFPNIKKGPRPNPYHPETGFFVTSYFAHINETLGLGGTPKVSSASGIRVATLRDPDGLRVMLIDLD
jgi:hypothetical protein